MSHNPADYAYIIGRLRALETRLPTANVLERMIDADSANAAFQVLNDLTFVSGSIGEHTADEFQTVLTEATKKMSRLLFKMSPNLDTLKFLWLKYDFHNLKVTLKARLVGHGYADVEHALVDLGCLRAEDWEQFVLEGKIPALTKGMHETMEDAARQYGKTHDPQIVDLIVDKHYLEEMLMMARRFRSALTIGYLQRLIDLTNLKTFIRCKELKEEESYLEAILLHGGRVPATVMTESYPKGYEELKSLLEQKMHADELALVLDEFLKEKTLLAAEKKITELLQSYMDESKKMSFGPEPVFAFFWRFENHMQILRTILVGKRNQLSADDIHKHVLTL
ncbi:V-type ATPase subunit [Candidatus Peregrinibacteria bacterium]|nr:V-type ATPase subunit [Candidatus Peregrinibacteria bacterium]